jgi:hypothetical protein
MVTHVPCPQTLSIRRAVQPPENWIRLNKNPPADDAIKKKSNKKIAVLTGGNGARLPGGPIIACPILRPEESAPARKKIHTAATAMSPFLIFAPLTLCDYEDDRTSKVRLPIWIKVRPQLANDRCPFVPSTADMDQGNG